MRHSKAELCMTLLIDHISIAGKIASCWRPDPATSDLSDPKPLSPSSASLMPYHMQDNALVEVPYDAIASNTTHQLSSKQGANEDGAGAMDLTPDDPWLWAAVHRQECLQAGHGAPAPLVGHGKHAWLAAVHRDRPCLHIGCVSALHILDHDVSMQGVATTLLRTPA